MNNSQNPRVSFTMSFNGLIVGGTSEYHPQKVNISVTRTVDYIEGETPEQTQTRVNQTDSLVKLLAEKIEDDVSSKIKQITDKLV